MKSLYAIGLCGVISIGLGLGQSGSDSNSEIGAPLPAWTSGTLDIHQIATGRGNSALIIMPDGTTLLVDAGAAGDGIPETDPHPDASRPPGQRIVRYLQRHLPKGAASLD